MSLLIRTSALAVSASLALLAACSGAGTDLETNPNGGAPPTPDDIEQRAATLAQSLLPSDAASVDGQPAYLELRRDGRRCAAPLCGGFFVSRVNRLSTPCADGSRAGECYVADLDFSALGLDDEQIAGVEAAPEDFVLRGEIATYGSEFGELGRLNVSEAWQGHAGVAARGAFLRLTNSGVVCITHPCPSLTAELLNSRLPTVDVAEVDLEGIGASSDDALAQLIEPSGLIVAALPVIVSGPGGRAIGLDASEYFIPLVAGAAACGSRGLQECAAGSFCAFPSDADCGRADVPGSCSPRPEACTFEYAPVCGCDGKTHGNACAAASAGVSVDFVGECDSASE